MSLSGRPNKSPVAAHKPSSARGPGSGRPQTVGALQPGLPAALEGVCHVTSQARDTKWGKQFQTKVISCDRLFL